MRKSKLPAAEWLPAEPTDEAVRARAYELWANGDRTHGHDQEHWFTARQLLLHEAKEQHEAHAHPFASAGTRTHLGATAPTDVRAQIAATGAEQRVRARHQPRRTETAFEEV